MSDILRIGVIGGSGLYQMDGLTNIREETVETPFGQPSAPYLIGQLEGTEGVELVFLPRHGRNHEFNPSEVNYRANVFGMKSLGVSWIISVSAVGSLEEAVVPGHIVVIDQFIDRTKARKATFFEDGLVAHIAFGDPVCLTLRQMLLEASQKAGATVHDGGTYVCMEGPAFSTRAESNLYRSWGARVIGMTNLPEAKLAREASISYATLAMATDYDCWHEGHDDVTVDQVIAVLRANVALAQKVIANAVPLLQAHKGPAPHHNALVGALLTPEEAISEERKQALAPLLGHVL
ncbi:MAG: S-methyl-5'-thioadenosine phosphorylase [Deltaproteobacteria bacterium]|nr:S-methyl-5'-thioadenosine phosphorylase [Deltaproteobacteria bacterium]|tara:strand:+ start:726 stop:1601 length:876 start_codon:yes stop_codon:yes gene_type:complete